MRKFDSSVIYGVHNKRSRFLGGGGGPSRTHLIAIRVKGVIGSIKGVVNEKKIDIF